MMETQVYLERLVLVTQLALEYLESEVLDQFLELLVLEAEVLDLFLELVVQADNVGQLVLVHNCWLDEDLAVLMSLE